MVSDSVGSDFLPWLRRLLEQALHQGRAHAVLATGALGAGQWEFARILAKAWLCEGNDADRPCHRCPSCHLVLAGTHPDLMTLVPEAARERLGLASNEDADAKEGADGQASKAKPSQDIKVDAVRALVGFAQTTSARGRGKVAVLYPAERLNLVAANALLKTLEEPPGGYRLVLASEAEHLLPKTVLSRCQRIVLPLPDSAQAHAWLRAQGMADPAVLLAAAGGSPLLALGLQQDGVLASHWAALAESVSSGSGAAFADWPAPRVLDAMQKLCHDLLSRELGAAPRYFSTEHLSAVGTGRGEGRGGERPGRARTEAIAALTEWGGQLRARVRHIGHPWNAPLLDQALLVEAQIAISRLRARPHAPRQEGAPWRNAPGTFIAHP